MNRLKTHWTWLLSGSVTLLAFAIFRYISPSWEWADWTGFGEDKTISEEETLQNGKLTVTKRITHFQSEKTLWDWLGLAGVIAIPIVLFQFQQQQQKRSEEQAEVEKEIASINLREEALQVYIDKIAELLIDKELKVLLKRLSEGFITTDDPKIDAALDVARARTLSILRRLDGDGERKSSVVRFLIDAELIQGLELLKEANLSRANLEKANLERVNLESANLRLTNVSEANLLEANLSLADLSETYLYGANFSLANLSKTSLFKANLSEANLSEANLSEANLSLANLSNANLKGSDLSKANLKGTDLRQADLQGANLQRADLSKANLEGANLEGANLEGANLEEASLVRATFYEAYFHSTNLQRTYLQGADFRGVNSLTPKQVKSANNWERAGYNSDLREQLGLPPE